MGESAIEVCPFCTLASGRILESRDHALAIHDAFPVSPGHTLIVTRRHVADLFELSPWELEDMAILIRSAKRRLDHELHPTGYNIGANIGTDAGQTVMHAHVHLIPRYRGDLADPRGGVRHVIPSKGFYSVKPDV